MPENEVQTDIENKAFINYLLQNPEKAIEVYWVGKMATTQLKLTVLDVFNGLLDGTVRELQQFTDKGAHRRVYAKDDKHVAGSTRSLYFRNKEGKDEKVSLNTELLHKGVWVAIPNKEQRVGYGIALTALIDGHCDLIRNESWSDQKLYLRRNDINNPKDYIYHDCLITLNGNSIFQPSNVSLFDKNWIMLKLPKGEKNVKKDS